MKYSAVTSNLNFTLANLWRFACATRRTPTRKRTVLPVLQTIQTLRFVLFNRAAQVVRPGGVLRLRLTDNAATRQSFNRIRDALPKVA